MFNTLYRNFEISIKGSRVMYQFQVAAGDPDYLALWDRMEKMPEDTVFSTIKEGTTRT